MANYIMVYRGGSQPATPEEGAAHKARWGVWLSDLGDAIVNPGTPMMGNKVVTQAGVSDDLGPHPLSGYTIVEADSMEEALEMAKTCPFIEMDGASLEVAQLIQMG